MNRQHKNRYLILNIRSLLFAICYLSLLLDLFYLLFALFLLLLNLHALLFTFRSLLFPLRSCTSKKVDRIAGNGDNRNTYIQGKEQRTHYGDVETVR